MNKKKIFTPIVILLIGIAMIVGLVKMRKKPEKKVQQVKSPLVTAQVYRSQTSIMKVNGNGVVNPDVSINLVSEVSGKVIKVGSGMKEGSSFEKGDILFQIDSTDYKLRLKSAKAQVLQQKMLLKTEQRNYEIAELEWQEFKKQNPEAEPDSLTLRIPQLKIAEANLASAEANLELAEINLRRTSVTAPFDGIVIKRNIDPGQFVGTGTALAMLYATDKALIKVPVKNSELKWLKSNFMGKAEITGSYSGEINTWKGRLVRKEAALDGNSRMTNLIIEVNNPYSFETPLPFGLFVDVEISGREVSNAVIIPRNLISNGSSIYTLKDSKVEIVNVNVLRLWDDNAMIEGSEGLSYHVITTQLDVVSQGMKVRVKKTGRTE